MISKKTIYLDPRLIFWLTKHGKQKKRTFSQEVSYLLQTFKEEAIKEESNDTINNN